MNKKNVRWAVYSVIISIVLAALFTILSNLVLEEAGYLLAWAVLLFIVISGVMSNMLGVAVVAAEEKPFHSMAAKKEKGAKEAIWLIKNAAKVSSFCSDVVGDIAGIITGTTMAILTVRMVADFSLPSLGSHLAISSLVVGLTAGGNAMGKGIAIQKSETIVFIAAKALFQIGRLFKKRGN